MKKLTRLLCGLLVLVMLLSACTGTKPETSTPQKQEETPVVQEEKKPGESVTYKDTLTIALEIEPGGVDIHNFGDSATNMLTDLLYDTLVVMNYETMELQPGLAESWEVSDDNMDITFHLRKGVLFSDGSELKSEDVKWSYERQLECERNAQKLDGIESIEVLNDYDVVFHLTAPNVVLLTNMCSAVCGIASHKCMDSGEFVCIATGPYQVVEWKSGSSITLAANENHYTPVKTKNLIFKIVPEETAGLISLEVGEVDICNKLSASNYQKVADNPELSLISASDSGIEFVVWNVTTGAPALTDKRVRQALSLACNREELVTGVMDGNGMPISTCVGYGVLYQKTNYDVDYGEYNIEKAKELLAEAGYPDGFAFTMLVKGSQQQLTAQILQSQYKKIGVEMEITFVENTTFFDLLNNRNFDAGMITRGNTTGDPSPQVSFLYGGNCGSAGNRGYWVNERFDELYELQMSEIDTVKRAEYFYEMQDIVMDEQPWLCMFAATKACGAVTGVGGIRLGSANNFYRDVFCIVDD